MTDSELETCRFGDLDAVALAFLREHGYVVLAPRFPRELLDETIACWRAYKQRCAAEMGLAQDVYNARVSQWRDLWHGEPTFAALLGDVRLWQVAANGLGLAGARLLHDHVIAKSISGLNDTIPWHQDATFWPVDRSGLSCWLPLVDIGARGGCLEVVDASHLWGAGAPVDFIAEPRTRFPDGARFVRVPATAGSIVVLDGLTWHRSGPNEEAGERPVYITLWLPPQACYVPRHAAWHPVNEHVEVAPGERLAGEWFPCFGEAGEVDDQPRLDHEGPRRDAPLTMFEASRTIAGQIGELLGEPGRPLALALARPDARRAVIGRAREQGLVGEAQAEELVAVLDDLWTSAEAYRLHRARNVYNAAYVAWWRLIGETLWARTHAGGLAG